MKINSLLPFVSLALLMSSTRADLIITEIMQNPNAVTDANGEWLEIFNSGPGAVDLENFVFSDNDTDDFTVAGSLVAAPGAYLVFARNGDTGTNGGVTADYV